MKGNAERDPLLDGKRSASYGNPRISLQPDEENQATVSPKTGRKLKLLARGDNGGSLASTCEASGAVKSEKKGDDKSGPQRYLYYVIYALV